VRHRKSDVFIDFVIDLFFDRHQNPPPGDGEMASNVTIPQIAEAAGVSTATVDRVLNDRPGVNPETVKRVRDAMAALGVEAPQRGRPRSAPQYRFAYALPATRLPFFDMVDRQIAQAAGDFRHSHITELTLRLDVADPQAYAAELARLTDYDGIALLAPDTPPAKLAINELVRAGVHVVTIFSDVPGSQRETFIGADNRAAGRTAGLLLGRAVAALGAARCALVSPATRYAAVIDRRIGYAQVLEERFPQVTMVRLNDLPEAEDEAYEAALKAVPRYDSDTPMHALYHVGAGSHGLARALAELGYPGGFPLAAHDLTETHRAMLVSGSLAYVLHQDIHYVVLTAARVLRGLCEGVRGALAVAQPNVDIVTAENLT
jgi:LacI family transcriptional regulator